MSTDKFYPELIELFDTDDIPEELGFIKTGIVNLLSKFYFKNFQYKQSVNGASAYYSLDLITQKGASIELPGTGFALRLNPSDSADLSEFPIKLNWSWELLSYIKTFDLKNFNFDPKEIFELILFILDLELPDLVLLVLKAFGTEGAILELDLENEIDVDFDALISEFVTNVNTKYSLSGAQGVPQPLSDNAEDQLLEVVVAISTNTALRQQSANLLDVVYKVYLEDAQPSVLLDNLATLFKSVLGDDPLGRFKEIITPFIELETRLEIGLQFPRSILTPLQSDGTPFSDGTHSIVLVGPFEVAFSTDSGLSYNVDLAGSLNHPSQVANTGFTIDIQGVKLDFSPDKSIAEAYVDNRTSEFVGIFIQTATIGLPPSLTASDETGNGTIIGQDLLIGTEGGLTGTFTLEGPDLRANLGKNKTAYLDITQFDVVFTKNNIDTFTGAVELYLPGFKDASGNPQALSMSLAYEDATGGGEYCLTATSLPTIHLGGIVVDILEPVLLKFDRDELLSFSIAADITIPGITNGTGEAIRVELGYDSTTGIYEVTAETTGTEPIDIFGAKLFIEYLHFEFSDSGLSAFVIDAGLLLPGAKDENGDDQIIQSRITKSGSEYSLTATGIPTIHVGGTTIDIHEPLEMAFDENGLQDFSVGADLTIPGITNGTAEDINVDISYARETNLFTVSAAATGTEPIDLGPAKLFVEYVYFEFAEGGLQAFVMEAGLCIEGAQDSKGGDGIIDVRISKSGNDYTLTATNLPDLHFGDLKISFPDPANTDSSTEFYNDFAATFDSSGLKSLDTSARLFIPSAKDSSGADHYFDLTISYDGAENEFGITAYPAVVDTPLQSFFIGETEIEFLSLGMVISDAGLQAFATTANIIPPGDDQAVQVAISGDKTSFGATATFSPAKEIGFFGLDMQLHSIGFTYNYADDFLSAFSYDGALVIPHAESGESGDPRATVDILLTYQNVADGMVGTARKLRTDVDIDPDLELDLFGVTLGISHVLVEVVEDSTKALKFRLDALAIDAWIESEALVDDTGDPVRITAGIAFNHSVPQFTLSGGASSGFKIGNVDLTLESFSVTFTKGQFDELKIAGQIVIDSLDPSEIDVDLVIDPNGKCSIAASINQDDGDDSNGLALAKGDNLSITLTALAFHYDKSTSCWGIEVGQPGGDGAFIEQALDLPLVGKFLPETIDINHLAFDSCEGFDSSVADVKVTWPKLDGFELDISPGNLTASIPVNKTILKTLTISTITVALKAKDGVATDGDPDNDNDTELNVLLDGGLKLGPIIGSVSGAGIGATITFPSDGKGNLGPLNIDDFNLVPPTGIGLAIDASGIKGGGYLEFNQEKGEYAGYVGLTIQNTISVNAIGLLNTKYPDGSKGVSLLLILTAEFSPGIQLGFGFSLTGLGGLLGLNRTMKLEELRKGVKNNTLDSILFPDPASFVQNAPTIISNIASIFPVDKGRFVFGPMAKIAWGVPALITAEIGLLIEVPKPIRLAILGVIKAILPDEEAALLKLQINFLGTVDFGKKQIAFDASLFDSKLLTFELSGDMAFRLNYGDKPAFLLSVGGFHPSFKPTIPVPSLKRLTVAIANDENFKVILTNYFAVTSNTVQFGSKVSLYAKIGPITAKGHLGFDVLFQFSPFYMIASISAGVAISFKKYDLASVYLEAELEGPSPWKVNGVAEFKICGVKKKFKLSKTFGQRKTQDYGSVDIRTLFIPAISDDLNWEVTTGSIGDQLVVIRNDVNATRLISATGTLSISQKVVPLDFEILKFGNRVPAGPRKFDLTKLVIGANNFMPGDGLVDIKDDFPPAEFKELDNSKKLSLPSFEKMKSGVKASNTNTSLFRYGAHFSERDLSYEQVFVDCVGKFEDDGEFTELRASICDANDKKVLKGFEFSRVESEARGGAAGKSSRSQTRTAIRGLNDKRVTVEEEGYELVDAETLTSIDGKVLTKAEAEEARENMIASNPRLRNTLQVMNTAAIV